MTEVSTREGKDFGTMEVRDGFGGAGCSRGVEYVGDSVGVRRFGRPCWVERGRFQGSDAWQAEEGDGRRFRMGRFG